MDIRNGKKIVLVISLIALLLLAACSAEQAAPTQDVQPSPTTAAEEKPSEEEPMEEMEAADVLAPDPQEMVFTASDGTQLNGIYYPGASANAPLIVLMHWALGDQYDYVEMAYWLQNRGLGGVTENPENVTWLDPTWFPEIAAGKSYAVFTFTFRNCEGGCQSFLRDQWLLDAQAAVDFAYNLDSIDQDKVVIVGASIGSDGAADGCLYLNQQYPDGCKGAFSMSPGNYLTLDYQEVIGELAGISTPAWCLYDESDSESAAACGGLEADDFTAYMLAGGHGMNLVSPDLSPNALELLLDFLSQTIG